MDFRHLRQFVVLSETLNFRKAAERLHMSQPPLSVSIRKLEAELGVPLFHRGKDGVRLTKSGEAALEEAKKALFHADEFIHMARAAETGERGILRIGFVGSATRSILPAIVPLFRQRYPGVQLVLRESRSTQIVDALDEGTLDIGIVRIPVPVRSTLKMFTLQTERLLLAVSRDHQLASKTNIKMAELADEEFIFYTEDAPGLRLAALNACQTHGFTPKISQEAVQVATLISLVKAGLGIALLPSVSYAPSERLIWKKVDDFPDSATIGISVAWRKENETSTIKNFQTVAQELFQDDNLKVRDTHLRSYL